MVALPVHLENGLYSGEDFKDFLEYLLKFGHANGPAS